MTDFYTELPLRLDWSEMDMFGHINNVMYFKFIQASRVHYWEHIGLNAWHRETNQGPMLAATSCQFRKPLFFPGDIKVQARPEWIKTTSFALQHRILDQHGDLAAEAQDVIVMYDFDKECKMAVPEGGSPWKCFSNCEGVTGKVRLSSAFSDKTKWGDFCSATSLLLTLKKRNSGRRKQNVI